MVKKSKGLSFDEKKSALSSAMIQEGSFYNMKELELLAKKHGVVPQSVKEVVDCLIGDRVIIQEKIGSLNIYWAFGSGEESEIKNKVDAVETDISSLRTRLAVAESELASYPNLDSSISMMRLAEAAKELSEFQAKQSELESKLNDLLKRDPETISRLASQRDQIKAQVNLWTDNIFILQQYITAKLGVSASTIHEAFSIPDDIDVID